MGLPQATRLSASGGGGLRPLTPHQGSAPGPRWGSAPDPNNRLALRARHMSPNIHDFPPSVATLDTDFPVTISVTLKLNNLERVMVVILRCFTKYCISSVMGAASG